MLCESKLGEVVVITSVTFLDKRHVTCERT